MTSRKEEEIMAEYLLKGGKMLEKSCKTCGCPLFEVKGKTLGECLNYLVNFAPTIKQALFYESGNELQGNIKVLVNKKDATTEGLDQKITDGDVIYIAMLPQH